MSRTRSTRLRTVVTRTFRSMVSGKGPPNSASRQSGRRPSSSNSLDHGRIGSVSQPDAERCRSAAGWLAGGASEGTRSSPGKVRVRGGSVYRWPVGLVQICVPWPTGARPAGVVFEPMMRSAQRIQVRRIGAPSVPGIQVIERVAMIQIAAPRRLPAGRESAGGGESGGDVPDRLRRSVGTGAGAGDAAGRRVEQHGGDRGGRLGNHQCRFRGDGAVPLEVAGEAVEPGEGGGRQCDGQVRAPSLPGGASRYPSVFPVAGCVGGQQVRLVPAGRTKRALCRLRCRRASQLAVGRRCDSLIPRGCRVVTSRAGRTNPRGVSGHAGCRSGRRLSRERFDAVDGVCRIRCIVGGLWFCGGGVVFRGDWSGAGNRT